MATGRASRSGKITRPRHQEAARPTPSRRRVAQGPGTAGAAPPDTRTETTKPADGAAAASSSNHAVGALAAGSAADHPYLGCVLWRPRPGDVLGPAAVAPLARPRFWRRPGRAPPRPGPRSRRPGVSRTMECPPLACAGSSQPMQSPPSTARDPSADARASGGCGESSRPGRPAREATGTTPDLTLCPRMVEPVETAASSERGPGRRTGRGRQPVATRRRRQTSPRSVRPAASARNDVVL